MQIKLYSVAYVRSDRFSSAMVGILLYYFFTLKIYYHVFKSHEKGTIQNLSTMYTTCMHAHTHKRIFAKTTIKKHQNF